MLKNLWVLINCKINKILSLFAIIIFLLSLSCANADSNRQWTESDIKNVIINRWLDKYNGNREEMINYINNQTWILELLHYINSYSQVAITFSNSRNDMYITMSNGTGKFSLANGSWNYGLQSTNASSTTKYYVISFHNSLLLSHYDTGTSSPSSYTMNQTYYYFGVPLYQGVNSNTIVKQAGTYSPSNFFAENYFSNTKWELIPNSSQQITIPNKTETYNALNKGTFTTTLANLQDSVYTDQIMMTIQAYNGTIWQTVLDKELFNIENGFMSDTFPSQTENNIMTSQIQVNSNIIPNNVIVVLRVYPNEYIANDLGLTELEQYYYITNAQTVINSNILDVSATFSGDTNYVDDVNQAITNEQNESNDNNIKEIVSSINDNSQVDSIVDQYFGTSGDLLNKLGYVSYGNPLVDTFYNILITIKNLLLSNQNITYDIHVHNTDWGTLSSADFTTSGAIRVFVQALIIFLIVRFILKLFYSSFENIVEGDIMPIINFFKGKASLITKFF